MKQRLNIGQVVDDGTGDYLRQAGQKILNNFDELYYELGDTSRPHAAGAWKTINSTNTTDVYCKFGQALALDTSVARITAYLPKGDPSKYNQVIRLRDVFGSWQRNPILLVSAITDTIKGSSTPRTVNLEFGDLELVYCSPGRWEYVENKRVDRITNSDLATVARKEFIATDGQTDFMDVFNGYDYNPANLEVYHRGNLLYYGDFGAQADYGSPGTPGQLVPLDGRNIRLKNACKAGDSVIIVSYMDGVGQWRSSYNRRQLSILDPDKTSLTTVEGARIVREPNTVKYITIEEFGIETFSPVNPNAFELNINGVLQLEAGTGGEPIYYCEGVTADNAQDCQAQGGNWVQSNKDYRLEIDPNTLKIQGIHFARDFEHGDIVTIVWYNNDIGTTLELEEIIQETDNLYVAQGPEIPITGAVAITDYNNPGFPNVEKVPDSIFRSTSVAAIFDLLHPIGTIYENAVNPNNPSTYMGFGQWVLWGQGRTIVGWNDDTSDPNFAYNNNDLDVNGNPSHTAGGTFGQTTTSITNDNLPATKTDKKVLVVDANGPVIVGGCQYDPDDQGPVYTKYREEQATTNESHQSVIPMTNIQPGVTAYRWLRVG
ncbi:baseplate wedge subunit [Pseudomonas phage PspYZU05]|uniref:Baseplate wedge protein gp10 n=1 Tax=Pseudomonas phage PspYZU05 TaxID=1983556 RepID=A0A2U7N2H6_9CAUD|nr:baseplate wedge subunit [Pseudomonas phage PspYZU05]ASD52070.1 baseplate wedge [Pseudomonas phage PspYZU05]